MDAQDAREAKACDLDDALALCYRHLGRREHSASELRARLERAALAPAVIDEAIETVKGQGYLDDARYTRLLITDRREIDGWGVERIRERLLSAGIDRELIEDELAGFDSAAELAAAAAVLRRRLRMPPASDQERQRAFGMLVRQGFDAEIAYEALRASTLQDAFADPSDAV